jgi:hypothetical protein
MNRLLCPVFVLCAAIKMFTIPQNAQAKSFGENVKPGVPTPVCQLSRRVPGKDFEPFCSATLVENDRVLTAAHCLDTYQKDKTAKSPNQYRVSCTPILASTDPSKVIGFKFTGEVTAAQVDPSYPGSDQNQGDHDLAYLSFKPSSSNTIKIAPAKLSEEPLTDPANWKCQVAGYGDDLKKRTDRAQYFDLSPNELKSLAKSYSKNRPHYVIEAGFLERSLTPEQQKSLQADLTALEKNAIEKARPEQDGLVAISISEYLRVIHGYLKVDATVADGDSGGAMICQKTSGPEPRAWTLIGVISGGHISVEEDEQGQKRQFFLTRFARPSRWSQPQTGTGGGNPILDKKTSTTREAR